MACHERRAVISSYWSEGSPRRALRPGSPDCTDPIHKPDCLNIDEYCLRICHNGLSVFVTNAWTVDNELNTPRDIYAPTDTNGFAARSMQRVRGCLDAEARTKPRAVARSRVARYACPSEVALGIRTQSYSRVDHAARDGRDTRNLVCRTASLIGQVKALTASAGSRRLVCRKPFVRLCCSSRTPSMTGSR